VGGRRRESKPSLGFSAHGGGNGCLKRDANSSSVETTTHDHPSGYDHLKNGHGTGGLYG